MMHYATWQNKVNWVNCIERANEMTNENDKQRKIKMKRAIRRQWDIEVLTVIRSLLHRVVLQHNANKHESDMHGWDALGAMDDIIDYELKRQRVDGMFDRELQFVDHILANVECEFVDNMMTHIGKRFILYYMNDISDVD